MARRHRTPSQFRYYPDGETRPRFLADIPQRTVRASHCDLIDSCACRALLESVRCCVELPDERRMCLKAVIALKPVQTAAQGRTGTFVDADRQFFVLRTPDLSGQSVARR